MKKVLKSRIFIIVILCVISCGIGVYGATKYKANEILYNETTVDDALNELYNKCGNSSSVPEPVSFAEDSWETIVANVKLGNISKYKVGDTKEIELTGFTNEEEGSNGLYTIRIANTSTPEECSTLFSQTACGFVIEFVDIITEYNMNSINTNSGGWRDSLMRIYVNDTIYNALPTELKENIINTYTVSGYGSSDSTNFVTIDKIYLLSTEEFWGNSNVRDTATSVTRQLDYYKNEEPEDFKYYNGTETYWWLRSAIYTTTNYFFYPNSGKWYFIDANYALGVAPAFRIG